MVMLVKQVPRFKSNRIADKDYLGGQARGALGCLADDRQTLCNQITGANSRWLAGVSAKIFWEDNQRWQAIETRTNGTASSNVTSQMVWSAAYINAAILQDTYSAGVLQPKSRLYFLQDANWNTTAVVGFNSTTGTWAVTQRYVYSPYGNITVLNADFSAPPTGTQPLVDNLYQGMTLDSVTGLYYERFRNYSPSLGTWISQDPLQYVNGADTYQFVTGNPAGATDPSGAFSWEAVVDIAAGAVVAVGAVAAAPVVATTIGGAIVVGLDFDAGMFGIVAGSVKLTVSAFSDKQASELPGTYNEAAIGLPLRAAGVPVEKANAISDLVPTPGIGPEDVPESAVVLRALLRALLRAKEYKEMAGHVHAIVVLGSGRTTGPAQPTFTMHAKVGLNLTVPPGFEPHLVAAGDNLWNLWRNAQQPKASWAQTKAVNSAILSNINSLYPGDYLLVPKPCSKPPVGG